MVFLCTDFHCVNPKYNGKRYQYSYLVSHTRHRDDYGTVKWVESRLIKISTQCTDQLDPLSYDSDQTVQHMRRSPTWQDPETSKPLSCYLRTPLFVSRQDAKNEDDGHLFCWSFDTEPQSKDDDGLRAYILMFDARNLALIMRVPLPQNCVIPYTVHSSIYSRPLDQHAEAQWEDSATVLTASK